MRRLFFTSLCALFASIPVVATAATLSPVRHSYPIHFDGPMIHHIHAQTAAQAAGTVPAVTGNLPTFDVTFHGGPIQTATKSFAIYWQPAGTYMSPTYKSLIDRFLTDAGGSAIYGMATTYFGSNGRVQNRSTFGGSWVDRTPYPAKGVTDMDLQLEVLKAATANGWTAGVNTQFFIMTAKNALPSVQFCAYHSAFDYGFPPRPKTFVYGFIPYVGDVNGCNVPFGITPNNDAAADGSILNLSHEQMEMVTDPLINAWYDDKNGGAEVGDICIYSFGVPIDNVGGNIDIGPHPYFLQEDYSQARGSCQPNL